MASISKNKSGGYRIRVSCGLDYYGRQIQRSMTWNPPKPNMSEEQITKEVTRAAVLFEEQCKNYATGNVTFAEYCEIWFEDYAEEHLKRRTIEEYHRYKKRVYAALGQIHLEKLKAEHFRRFYKQLGQPGANERTGKPLSAKTIVNYHAFCSAVCEYAVKNEIIPRNPCSLAAPKRGERTKVSHMDEQQLGKFLAQLDRETIENQVFFRISLQLGTRRGETLGLEWSDIDFERSTLTIRRTSQYSPESGTFTGSPKTESSARTLPIPQNLLQLLWRYRSEQLAHIKEMGDLWTCGEEWKEHPRLFTAENGSPLNPSLPTKRMNAIFRRAGLPHFSLHSMRHTAASWLVQNADVRTVSGILGHSQTSTTMNIYAEFLQSPAHAATNQLEAAYEEIKREAQSPTEENTETQVS